MDDGTPIKELLRYQGEFLAYLMAITRDYSAAEEVFQNAAVVIIEGATAGEPIRNFRAWAKEIVRRQALYYLRKQGQQAKHRRPLDLDLFEAISDAFLEEDDGPGVEVQALRRCLDKVPAPQRRMLAMRYEGRASFEQIAETVGTTAGAVQRALSRLRKALHDCVRTALRTEERA
ncbi:MAG: sigma-70 family RNA polymerase sigma factor [Planctomycetia bacterium]|nr:sigma-70 family RNA polymerase sigma factor [Planctomycetia bacterium]